MTLRFTNMHGLGNAFFFIDGFHKALTLGQMTDLGRSFGAFVCSRSLTYAALLVIGRFGRTHGRMKKKGHLSGWPFAASSFLK